MAPGLEGASARVEFAPKLEITVQSTGYNHLRLGVGQTKPCWYMVAGSLCEHQDGRGFLTVWSAQGPRVCVVSDTRGSGSFVGIKMIEDQSNVKLCVQFVKGRRMGKCFSSCLDAMVSGTGLTVSSVLFSKKHMIA